MNNSKSILCSLIEFHTSQQELSSLLKRSSILLFLKDQFHYKFKSLRRQTIQHLRQDCNQLPYLTRVSTETLHYFTNHATISIIYHISNFQFTQVMDDSSIRCITILKVSRQPYEIK